MKKQILEGKLKPGDSIPAMRRLAKILNVSVITVQKAYEILRDEGFLNTVVGRGTVVTLPKVENLKVRKKEKLVTDIRQIINLAYSNGFNKNEILDIFEEQYDLVNKE